MADSDRLDETALKALISDEIHASVLYDRQELADTRRRNLEYYQGVMSDTPSEANRSSVMSRDVSDTIGWMLPGIIRVFTASDRMAEFEPVKQSDEPFAKQATDYLNHVFWKDNPGYKIMWDGTHDSLLQGNGVVKHWWDNAEECEYSEHSGLTEDQVAILTAEPDVEIVAQKEGEPQSVIMPGQNGQMMKAELATYDIKLKRVTMNGRVRIECIPPEDFLIDREATCIAEARFVAHRDDLTRTELIEMGFSRDVVENLPTFRHSMLSEERQARDDDYFDGLGPSGHRSMELIEVFECYVRADADGDGIAETIRAYYAGNAGSGELLDWEVWDDEVPFSDIPCDPVPHRWDARSIADETIDMQRVKTVLTRQMLDNLYWINSPQRYAVEGSVRNPEEMVQPTFGGTVWLKNGTVMPPTPLPVPFIADKALLGLEHFDNVIEKRTGVSRATMALDPETLQNQTATANQNQRDAAYSQIELIARNQAELGWRNVFKKLLKLIVKHQDRPRTIRLRDQWVEMDPRHWNASMDVTINVGLGSGSRDRDMAMLNNILMTQQAITERLAGSGFSDKALDMLPKIVRTATKMAESAGIRNAEEFYPQFKDQDIAQMKQQAAQAAQQGDPKIQLEREKAKLDMQIEQARMQMDSQKAQQDIMLQREKIAGEIALKREQLQAEMALKREQLIAELTLKREQMQAELAMKERLGVVNAGVTIATSEVHPGGDPG